MKMTSLFAHPSAPLSRVRSLLTPHGMGAARASRPQLSRGNSIVQWYIVEGLYRAHKTKIIGSRLFQVKTPGPIEHYCTITSSIWIFMTKGNDLESWEIKVAGGDILHTTWGLILDNA